tara:strand:+ start:550 stop:1176 length:627 start_codon:yes stop_codon:yes gene_type:complete
MTVRLGFLFSTSLARARAREIDPERPGSTRLGAGRTSRVDVECIAHLSSLSPSLKPAHVAQRQHPPSIITTIHSIPKTDVVSSPVRDQLGIPSTEERIEMTLKSGKKPGMTAREYIKFASDQRKAMGILDESGVGRALESALGELEGKSGKPLMVDDAAGMKALYSKVEAIVAAAGLDSGDAKKESMVLEAEFEIKKLQEEVAKNAAA